MPTILRRKTEARTNQYWPGMGMLIKVMRSSAQVQPVSGVFAIGVGLAWRTEVFKIKIVAMGIAAPAVVRYENEIIRSRFVVE